MKFKPSSTRARSSIQRSIRRAVIESLETRTLLSTYLVTKVDGPVYGSYGADDGSVGTLRWAVNSANIASDPSIINMAPNLSGTITLTSGELELNPTQPITINGPGANLLTISGYVATSNGSATRIFRIDSGVTASISGLEISSGTAYNNDDPGKGGGIFNAGSLSLSSCAIEADDAFGASYNYNSDFGIVGGNGLGGGIYSTGTLVLTNSLVAGNDAIGGSGGEEANGGNGYGGGIYSTGNLTLINSTVSSNQAVGGSHGYHGGSGGPGSGLSDGVGVYATGAIFAAYDSAFVGNANAGNGVVLPGGAVALVDNTLVIDNVSGSFNPASSSNLIFGASGTAGLTTLHNNIFTTAPGIAGISDHGGPIRTPEPGPNSPALGAGDPTLVPSAITTDARGFPRTVGGNLDIGPVETTGFQIVFTTLAGNGTVNATLPAVTVTLEDAAGHILYDDSNSVSLTLNGPGTLTVGQASFQTGQETFSNLSIDTPGLSDTFTASYPGVSTITSNTFVISAATSSSGTLFDVEFTDNRPNQPQTGAGVFGTSTDPAWRSIFLSSPSGFASSLSDTTGVSSISVSYFGSFVTTPFSIVPLLESALAGNGQVTLLGLQAGTRYNLVLYYGQSLSSFSINGYTGTSGSSPLGNYIQYSNLTAPSGSLPGFTWSLGFNFFGQINGFQLQSASAATAVPTQVNAFGGTYTFGEQEGVSAYVTATGTFGSVTNGVITFSAVNQSAPLSLPISSPPLNLAAYPGGFVFYNFGTSLGIGTWLVTAAYTGDSAHASSQGTTFITVTAATNTWNGSGDGFNWSNPVNWSNQHVPTAGEDVVIGAGFGTIQIPGGVFNVKSLTAASPLEIATGATLILNSTATFTAGLTVDNGGQIQMPVAPVVVTVSTLNLIAGGLIDLGGNSLFIQTALASDIQALLKQGFNAGQGYWNGAAGILSTAAAGDATTLTTLGVLQVGAGVSVKYTYYGDADLTGSLDGADYQQIDQGFGLHKTGWSNGDFNYDGAINGSDFALIDNAFNQITAKSLSPLALQTKAKPVKAVAAPLAASLPTNSQFPFAASQAADLLDLITNRPPKI